MTSSCAASIHICFSRPTINACSRVGGQSGHGSDRGGTTTRAECAHAFCNGVVAHTRDVDELVELSVGVAEVLSDDVLVRLLGFQAQLDQVGEGGQQVGAEFR